MLESPAMLCSSLFVMVGTTQSAAKSGKVSFRESSWRLALFYPRGHVFELDLADT